ncbi:hypothetical protein J6590_078919 [Homalodisca vitripennis]|nr:hypothetical protein J6590_091939 [Homalodisca vitripennis]KAG8335006.1 hypothetical protein J6590_078919 [Homalodisca vitripennis]
MITTSAVTHSLGYTHQLLHHSYIRSLTQPAAAPDNTIYSYYTVSVIHNINCCTTPTSGHITSTCCCTVITPSIVTTQSRLYTTSTAAPLLHPVTHFNPLLHRDNAVYSYYTVSVIHNINCCTTPTSGHITSTCGCTVITPSIVTTQSRLYTTSTAAPLLHPVTSLQPAAAPPGIHNINCCTTPTSGHITSTCSCTVITTSAVTSQSRYTQHQLLHHSYIRSHNFNLQLHRDNNICSYFTVQLLHSPGIHNINCCTTPTSGHITSTCSCTVITTSAVTSQSRYTQHQLLHHSYIRSHHINLQLDQDNNICSYFTVKVYTTSTAAPLLHPVTSHQPAAAPLGYTQHQLLHHSYIRSHHFNLQLDQDNNICSNFTVSVIHINYCTTPTSGHITSTCSWTKITTSAVTSQSRYTQHQLLHHSYIRSHHINPQLHRDNAVYSYYTVSVIHNINCCTTPTSVSVIHNINCCTTPTSGHITSTCSWTKITTSAVTSQSRYTQHQLLHHSYIRSHHINLQLHRDNNICSYFTVSVIHINCCTTPTSGHITSTCSCTVITTSAVTSQSRYTQHQLLHHSYIRSHHINLQLDQDNNICSYFTVHLYTSTTAPLRYPLDQDNNICSYFKVSVIHINYCTTPTSGHITSTCSWTKITTSAVTSQSRLYTSTTAPLLHPLLHSLGYTQHQLLHHSYIRSHHINLQLDHDKNICSYFTFQVYTTSTAAPLLHPLLHSLGYTQHQLLHHSYIRSHHFNLQLDQDNNICSYFTVSVIHNINCCTTPTSGHITSTCSWTMITTSAVTSQSRYTQHQLLHHSYIRSHHINLQLDRDNNICSYFTVQVYTTSTAAPLLHPVTSLQPAAAPPGIHNINCCTTPTSGHITSTCSCTVITTSAVTSQSRYTQHQLLHHSYIRSHHFNLQLHQDNNICSYFTVSVIHNINCCTTPTSGHITSTCSCTLLHSPGIHNINCCTTPTSGHITSTCSWTKITTSAVTSQSRLYTTSTAAPLLHPVTHFNLWLHRDNTFYCYYTVSVIHNINCCTTPTSGHITSTCSWTKITTSAVTSQSRYTQHQLLHHSYIRSHHINLQLHRDNNICSYFTVQVYTTSTAAPLLHPVTSHQPAAAPLGYTTSTAAPLLHPVTSHQPAAAPDKTSAVTSQSRLYTSTLTTPNPVTSLQPAAAPITTSAVTSQSIYTSTAAPLHIRSHHFNLQLDQDNNICSYFTVSVIHINYCTTPISGHITSTCSWTKITTSAVTSKSRLYTSTTAPLLHPLDQDNICSYFTVSVIHINYCTTPTSGHITSTCSWTKITSAVTSQSRYTQHQLLHHSYIRSHHINLQLDHDKNICSYFIFQVYTTSTAAPLLHPVTHFNPLLHRDNAVYSYYTVSVIHNINCCTTPTSGHITSTRCSTVITPSIVTTQSQVYTTSSIALLLHPVTSIQPAAALSLHHLYRLHHIVAMKCQMLLQNNGRHILRHLNRL